MCLKKKKKKRRHCGTNLKWLNNQTGPACFKLFKTDDISQQGPILIAGRFKRKTREKIIFYKKLK